MTRYEQTPPTASDSSVPLAPSAPLERSDNHLTQNYPNPDRLEASSEQAMNLIQVRRGLTAFPQTTFADFKISPHTYGMEIRLPLNRIRGSLIAAVTKQQAGESTRFSLWLVVGMALLVGSSVVLTSSAIFGGIIAVVLPVALWLITLSEKVKDEGEATLRLVNAPDGRTFLSMTGVLKAHHTAFCAKSVVYFSNRSVQLVSAKTTLSGGQLSFILYAGDPRQGNRLRITGNRQEIRWLHAQITKWGRGKDHNNKAGSSEHTLKR